MYTGGGGSAPPARLLQRLHGSRSILGLLLDEEGIVRRGQGRRAAIDPSHWRMVARMDFIVVVTPIVHYLLLFGRRGGKVSRRRRRRRPFHTGQMTAGTLLLHHHAILGPDLPVPLLAECRRRHGCFRTEGLGIRLRALAGIVHVQRCRFRRPVGAVGRIELPSAGICMAMAMVGPWRSSSAGGGHMIMCSAAAVLGGESSHGASCCWNERRDDAVSAQCAPATHVHDGYATCLRSFRHCTYGL